jgi:curved DNA-binding protein CbpA
MFSQPIADGYPESVNAVDQEYSPDEISAYYLELDQVLDRIERASNHYQILDLDRLATTGEIKLAYLRSVALLNPSQLGINLEVPETMLSRIDPAFERVSRAYSTLVNFARRIEYDTSLNSRGTSSQASEEKQSASEKSHGSASEKSSSGTAQAKSGSDSHEFPKMTRVPKPIQLPAFVRSGSVKSAANDNRRRCERFKLSVPVHVTGYDRKGGRWHEATRTLDVSRTGVLLHLRRRMKKGMVLYLTMPLPVRLRTRDFQEPTYVSYGLVRRVEAPSGHVTAVGVELLGPHPPDGYLERPWEIFQSEQWSGSDRRRSPRHEKTEAVLLEYFNESMECVKQETAVTENISRGGLRVVAKAAPPDFVMIRVNSVRRGFNSFAAVCDRFPGKDGHERLCLRLLESEWPA